MNLSDLSKELFWIEGGEARVRNRVIIEDMELVKIGVVETMDEVWVAGSLQKRPCQSSLSLQLGMVDTKTPKRWWAEEDFFFRFDELIFIDPTFDIAMNLVYVQLS